MPNWDPAINDPTGEIEDLTRERDAARAERDEARAQRDASEAAEGRAWRALAPSPRPEQAGEPGKETP